MFLVCVIVALWLFSGGVGVVVSLLRPVTESGAVARMSAMLVQCPVSTTTPLLLEKTDSFAERGSARRGETALSGTRGTHNNIQKC